MLRLFLDYNDGAAIIPCPQCSAPLILGAERRGRWVVGYRGGFGVKPGKTALLICPGFHCGHREPVEIADSTTDAVAYSPSHASGMFQMELRLYEKTLDDLRAEMMRLHERYCESGEPKLPWALRMLKERYQFEYWNIKDYLERSLSEGREVVCEGRGRTERGRVQAVLHDGVLFERTETREVVFLRSGELRSVSFRMELRPQRFDFGEKSHRTGHHPIHTPFRFVVVTGFHLGLDTVTRYGLCRVRTHDPVVARAMRMRQVQEGLYLGEFPSALVERTYRSVRYCHVRGRRLHLLSFTRDPDVFQLETRDFDAARELRMHRAWHWLGQRQALRWWGYFHREEIEEQEELRVPMRLPTKK